MLGNVRYETFAQELAKGRSAFDAYVTAGFKPDRGNCIRLQQRDIIRQRVEEMLAVNADIERQATQKAAEELSIDKAWVMARLMENALTGQKTGDLAPSNRAIELLGKELGMFIDRTESTHVVRDITDQPPTADEWAGEYVTAH